MNPPNPPSKSAAPAEFIEYAQCAADFSQRLLCGEARADQSALNVIHQALVSFPADLALPERINALAWMAQHYCVSGNALSGIEPSIDAINAARRHGDPFLLMRALSTCAYCLCDTVDVAGAAEYFAEALEMAIATKNVSAESALWNGLGAAFVYSGQYEQGRQCFVRALDSEGQSVYGRAVATTSLALVHLYGIGLDRREELDRGLQYARKAIACQGEAKTPNEMLTRVLAENCYVRLLLEVGDLAEATARAAIAKALAVESQSEKAKHSASIAEGLCEVAAGKVDVGLSRLQQLLESARTMRTELRDTLLALIGAYRSIGLDDRADTHVRELSYITRMSQRDYLKARLAILRRNAAPPVGQPLSRAGSSSGGSNDPQLELLEHLALQADIAEDPSGLHPVRVGRLSLLLAAEYGIEPEMCSDIEAAGRLHDIGKYALKKGLRSPREFPTVSELERMKMHTEVGDELLNIVSDMPVLALIRDVIRHHHERFDGSGYPDGISRTAIPLAARIVAIANAFDSLVWCRGKRPPYSVDRALEAIIADSGVRFDPQLAELFVSLVQRLRRMNPQWRKELEAAAPDTPYSRSQRRIAKLLEVT